MAWKHIPDNEEAWLYYQADILYFGSEEQPDDMRRYWSPPNSWRYDEWMCTAFDGYAARKNYINLED